MSAARERSRQVGAARELCALPTPKLDGLTNDALRAYFEDAWRLNERLFGAIQDEAAFFRAPDPLRHPLIFYWGHTAAFYVNKMRAAALLDSGLNPSFEHLFEQGVDPKCADDLALQSWPSLDDVTTYRRLVFECVSEQIDAARIPEQFRDEHPLWSILMGIEHDRIHFETSSMLLRQLPTSALQRPEGWSYAPTFGSAPSHEYVPMAPGNVTLGKSKAFPTFGWDNEYGARDVCVPAFEAGRNLVTNAEFLDFVLADGYANDALWTGAGRAWRDRSRTSHPRFWIKDGPTFRYRAMFDDLDLPLDWPAEVNALEAQAFCAWKQARLLREAEHARLAQGASHVDGDSMWSPAHNLALRFGSPTPVARQQTQSDDGLYDVHGNVWQWLEDDFSPLSGFQPHTLYPDFSEPYFTDRHAVLLGGSWATTGAGASRFYRLWFRRFFFQHAGFRMARDARPPAR